VSHYDVILNPFKFSSPMIYLNIIL